MKTFLIRLTLLAAALPLFASPAQEEPDATPAGAARNEWFVGSGVPVFYNSTAEYQAATGRTLEYGEAPVLAALVASGDLPPVGERCRTIRSSSPRPSDRSLRRHPGDSRRSRLDQRRVHASVGPHHTGERRNAVAQRVRLV